MAGRLPANHPLLPLHGPLRKDETLSERRCQHRAARDQLRTAPRAAHEPAGLVGSGRICLLRTDHLGGVEPDHGNAHRRRLSRLAQGATSRRKTLQAGTGRAGQREPDGKLVVWLEQARHAEARAACLAGDVRTLVHWLSHDVLALAGPDLATRRELFDFIVAELTAREPEDPRRI